MSPSPTEIASALARFVEPLSQGVLPVETLSEEGDPVRIIVAKATELSCDLIVLGTHGRGGFEHLVLGSVTEKVLRKAACPVLIVPPAVTQPARPIQFKRILCPLDFGPSSGMALRQALAVARETGAHLTVLHVLEPLEDEPRVVPVAVPEYRRLREEQAREDLHRALSAEEHAETVGMLVTGNPYREIVRVARETSTDLIFMGVAGGGTLRRLFLGSTTNHVVREATCPVLTLRAPQSTEHTSSEELVETART